MSDGRLKWEQTNTCGTCLVGYLNAPYPFKETVARLVTLSGQDPTKKADGDKVTVEFAGTFEGKVFTLYDYKGDNDIHIGGHDVNLNELRNVLLDELGTVAPTLLAKDQREWTVVSIDISSGHIEDDTPRYIDHVKTSSKELARQEVRRCRHYAHVVAVFSGFIGEQTGD